tara:strand:- start:6582 stop:9047 length:2466 start_codon:yes stop_codon:yes gene_type:complete
MADYNFKKIEKKWQKNWEDSKIFEVKDSSKKKKYYVLDMFPYPSGEGLHMGHAFTFSLGDIYARFKRLQGFNVLYPMGDDSLGLPAENAAIKAGKHPEDYTKNSVKNFMAQEKAMGWSYDWSRKIQTHDPAYYKWDQWIFLKMLEKGIAYRKKAPVNWCGKCNTVLANEQVIGGKCWRHEDTEVSIKHLEQWFFRITDYAEELLDHKKLDWPERAKIMQRHWIGKSYGTEIEFEINGDKWPIFTTRPDTIYGVTFMVISAQHPKLMELVSGEQKGKVEGFLKRLKSVSEKELESMDKEGIFTGSYAVNPVNGDKIPVYAGNFVLADYGSGMVMAVPAHDQRDFEFASKYGIDIKVVVDPKDSEVYSRKGQLTGAYTDEGSLINSGEFDGLQNKEAMESITKYLTKKKLGKKAVNYKLRDWLVSRQRYWGTPIPVVYCDDCGIVPVPEKDLPIKLPKEVKFGKGNPLATNEKFINVKCPKCKGEARRETDTMDTFVNSSWYYLRYCDPHNGKKIFDSKKVGYWCPVDQYIGGPEHITMHLMYFRFYTKFLRDIGLLNFDEPALKYFTQGIVKGSDGEKMSKSKPETLVEPLDTIAKYGADSLRMYLMSNVAPDNNRDWDEKGIQSSFKFLNKVYDYFSDFKPGKSDPVILSKLNKSIKEITDYVENFKYNLAVIKIRDLFNSFSDGEIDGETGKKFLSMLHVYCPFITEELWEKIGEKGFISFSDWPSADEKKIDDNIERREQAVGNLISDLNKLLDLVGKKNKAFVYVLPNEIDNYKNNLDLVKKRAGLDVEVFAVNDKKKYDPKNKGKKAKPGKPAIYLE